MFCSSQVPALEKMLKSRALGREFLEHGGLGGPESPSSAHTRPDASLPSFLFFQYKHRDVRGHWREILKDFFPSRRERICLFLLLELGDTLEICQ